MRPVAGDDGSRATLQGLMLDVTQRKRLTEERDHLLEMAQAARAEAEATAERARFLAEASDLLASSLDRGATLDSLVRLAVPGFADWCVVHLAEPIGGRRLHAAGEDPDGTGMAEMFERLATSAELPGAAAGLDAGEGRPAAAAARDRSGLDGEPGGAVHQLAPKSAMVVPMTARGRAIGTLSFIADAGPTVATVRPTSRWPVISPSARPSRWTTRGSTRRRRAPTAPRISSSPRCRTSCARRSPRCSAGCCCSAPAGWAARRPPRALASIERNTRVQAQLINDLLDVSRIVAGKLQVDKRPVDLRVVIEHALDSVRPRHGSAQARGLRRHRSRGGLGRPATPCAWSRSCVNLLGNAAKFTPEGGRIEVRLDRHESTARVTVSDTGQGIDPAMLPHIFETFHQADSSSTRRHGGLGLGLAIVRRLVALHGGRVEAASAGPRSGRGVHRVSAAAGPRGPAGLARARPARVRRPREDAALPRLDRLRALVVDDHEDSRRLVKTVLADCGADVREADSVDAALDILGSTYVDVLISDIGMPGADGYDLIARVREHEREHGGRIPAVALTAYAGEENRDRALAAGFTAHVTKPVSPAALVRIVADVARPSRAAVAASGAVTRVTELGGGANAAARPIGSSRARGVAAERERVHLEARRAALP